MESARATDMPDDADERMPLAAAQALHAIHRAAAMRGFVAHALIFAIAIALALATGADWTLFWPLVGWTLGILVHAVAAFGPGQFLVAPWEAQRLRDAARILGDIPDSGRRMHG